MSDTPEPRTGTDELIDALGKAKAERDAAVEERDEWERQARENYRQIGKFAPAVELLREQWKQTWGDETLEPDEVPDEWLAIYAFLAAQEKP